MPCFDDRVDNSNSNSKFIRNCGQRPNSKTIRHNTDYKIRLDDMDAFLHRVKSSLRFRKPLLWFSIGLTINVALTW